MKGKAFVGKSGDGDAGTVQTETSKTSKPLERTKSERKATRNSCRTGDARGEKAGRKCTGDKWTTGEIKQGEPGGGEERDTFGRRRSRKGVGSRVH